MKKVLLLLASLILLGVLVVVYLPITPNEPAPTKVGADRDAHGCIASAGYTYSVVLQECIRLWETATALAPTVALGNPALPAYVVRSANWQYAEVYLPGQTTGLVLTLKTTPGDPTWSDAYNTWQLTYDKIQGWKLAQDGQVIYTAGVDKV